MNTCAETVPFGTQKNILNQALQTEIVELRNLTQTLESTNISSHPDRKIGPVYHTVRRHPTTNVEF